LKNLQEKKPLMKKEDELIILTVGEWEPHRFPILFDADKEEETKKKLQVRCEAIVAEYLKAAEAKGIEHRTGKVTIGCPRDTIVAEAEKEGVDVLVVGARGLGVIRRLLLGSVSDFVMKHAHCHVLIAKQPPEVAAPPSH